jgi:hypothetical protein
MTIGIIIFIAITVIGTLVSQGDANGGLSILKYVFAYISIIILLILACATAYAYLIHHLWNLQ